MSTPQVAQYVLEHRGGPPGFRAETGAVAILIAWDCDSK